MERGAARRRHRARRSAGERLAGGGARCGRAGRRDLGTALRRLAALAGRRPGGGGPAAARGSDGGAPPAVPLAGRTGGGLVRQAPAGGEAWLLTAVAADDLLQALEFGAALAVVHVGPLALAVHLGDALAAVVGVAGLLGAHAVVRVQRSELFVLGLLLVGLFGR